jgi:anthranilate phosphoribosyltransferase
VDTLLRPLFEKLTARRDLCRDEARLLFDRVMEGAVPEIVLGAFVGALRTKGVVVDELVGAALAMRARSVKVRCAANCIDTCGTGGDGISTFNVSTAAAIIAASAGATVAKHGNRSSSRVSGSTEVLDVLGIDTEAGVDVVERCLAEARIGYLNARLLHPAMKHASPVRQAIGVRTIFNLLGPLTNPAGAKRQILGVPRPELLDLVAGALLELDAEHAWVLHGGGLCDLTITDETTIVEVRSGRLRRRVVTPESVGLKRAILSDLMVSSPGQSAAVMLDVFRGQRGPQRDHALLSAGAALVVAGVAEDLTAGVQAASAAVDDGRAMVTLAQWRSLAPRPEG